MFSCKDESSCRARGPILDLESVFSVIRPAQADLLEIEASARAFLLSHLVSKAYNLKTILLIFCKFEHTFTVGGSQGEDAAIIPWPRGALLGDATWSAIGYSIQGSGLEYGRAGMSRLGLVANRIILLLPPTHLAREYAQYWYLGATTAMQRRLIHPREIPPSGAISDIAIRVLPWIAREAATTRR